MFTYLTLLNSAKAGCSFLLVDEGENLIGRGLDCRVVLDDPLSSRVHAIIERREGRWFIRDAGSRNGTFVNGQKADEAQLIDGCHIKTGTTEFSFNQSEVRPARRGRWVDPALTQTIVRDTPVQAAAASTTCWRRSKIPTGRAICCCCIS